MGGKGVRDAMIYLFQIIGVLPLVQKLIQHFQLCLRKGLCGLFHHRLTRGVLLVRLLQMIGNFLICFKVSYIIL